MPRARNIRLLQTPDTYLPVAILRFSELTLCQFLDVSASSTIKTHHV